MRRVAVLTNKPLRHTERLLDGLGVRQLFDDVMGGDGPHPRKPSPDGLRALMAEPPAPPEQTTLMVGDSMVDYETARNAGVRVLPGHLGVWLLANSGRHAAGRAVGGERAAGAGAHTSSSFFL